MPTAFSLVEVVLAVGIATFGILLVVGLLPVGMQSTRTSLEETAAINFMGAIIIDRQATPYDQTSKIYALPALTDGMTAAVSGVFGVTEGNQHTTQLDKARYRVSYTLMPPAQGSLDPFRLWLNVSWPADNDNPGESVEGVATFPQP